MPVEVEKEFAAAIGMASLTFGRTEQLLLTITLQLEISATTNGMLAKSELQKLTTETLKPKLDRICRHLKQCRDQDAALRDCITKLYEASQIRNFIIHGLWSATERPGSYRCAMIGRKGQEIKEPLTTRQIVQLSEEAAKAAESLITALRTSGAIRVPIPLDTLNRIDWDQKQE